MVSNAMTRKLTLVHQPNMKLPNRPSLLCIVKVASKQLNMLLQKPARAAAVEVGIECTRASRINWWGESKVVSKITITPTAKQAFEQKKQSPRAYGEQQAPDSSKPKLTKEVLPEKDHAKRAGTARTPEKLEEVGPSDAPRKRHYENLPLAYCSPHVIRLQS